MINVGALAGVVVFPGRGGWRPLRACMRLGLTALKLGKSPTLWGGAVSMGNCRKGFMSRWGWITVGVLRKVGTAPVLLMLPVNTHTEREEERRLRTRGQNDRRKNTRRQLTLRKLTESLCIMRYTNKTYKN